MRVLFESPVSFALFRVRRRVLGEGILENIEELRERLNSPEGAVQVLKLTATKRFGSKLSKAHKQLTKLRNGVLSNRLSNFLQANLNAGDILAVGDSALANEITIKLNFACLHDDPVALELLRGVRSNLTVLMPELKVHERVLTRLSNDFARSQMIIDNDKTDSVDIIISGIHIYDDLGKELTKYAERFREWYGYHFPELSGIIPGRMRYVRVANLMGRRSAAAHVNFSQILPDEHLVANLRAAALDSSGADLTDDDMTHLMGLCSRVLDIDASRTSLYDMLQNRMDTVAPNLKVLVGGLVAARLISCGGGLISLSSMTAGRLQVLASPNHDILHRSSIFHQTTAVQAALPLHKGQGRISRSLAAKCVLAARVDANRLELTNDLGVRYSRMIGRRLRNLGGDFTPEDI